MDFAGMERERNLIEEVERLLPEFVEACKSKEATVILMTQDAFAPLLHDEDIFLFGKAIKYAGIAGKEVRIFPSKPTKTV